MRFSRSPLARGYPLPYPGAPPCCCAILVNARSSYMTCLSMSACLSGSGPLSWLRIPALLVERVSRLSGKGRLACRLPYEYMPISCHYMSGLTDPTTDAVPESQEPLLLVVDQVAPHPASAISGAGPPCIRCARGIACSGPYANHPPAGCAACSSVQKLDAFGSPM